MGAVQGRASAVSGFGLVHTQALTRQQAYSVFWSIPQPSRSDNLMCLVSHGARSCSRFLPQGRIAGKQLPQGHLHIEGLPAQDSPAQLCEQVLSYVQGKGICTAVLAQPYGSSTGSGGWLPASLQRLVGRSTLADRLLRQLNCPVIVLRD